MGWSEGKTLCYCGAPLFGSGTRQDADAKIRSGGSVCSCCFWLYETWQQLHAQLTHCFCPDNQHHPPAMIRSASFNTSSQPPAKQPFSFGGFNSTNNAAGASGSTGTTFGAPATNTANTTSQPGQTGGTGGFSFGAPAAQQPQAGTSTFGFGNTNTAQAGATGTGASTSLFGNTAAKPGGLTFGQPSGQQQQQQQPSTTGGLFGNTSGGGLFGGGAAQPAATSGTAGGGGGLNLGGSLFGASTNNAGPSAFGTQQQTQGQQQQSALLRHPFYQKERFNDLNEDARNLLTEMDKMITSQTNLRDELKSKLIPAASSSQEEGGSVNLTPLGRQIASLYQTLRHADGSLSSLNSSLESELANARSLSGLVERDRQDFVVLWEIGSAFREGRAGAGENRRDWIRE